MRAPRLTLLPILLCFLSATAAAATFYKWVDENGVTHYSDQPHPGGTIVEVNAAQSVSSSSVTRSAASAPAAAGAGGPRYPTCEIYRPENDEVFLNTSTITAKVRLEPRLASGDRIAIAVDGRRQTNQPPTGTDFVINDVARGTHTLFMVVEDPQGNPVCTSPTIQFHVRQPSVQAPVKALRPRF